MPNHPPQAALLAFVQGRSTDPEIESIFGHLEECEGCAARLTVLREIGRAPERAWELFEEELRATSRTHERTQLAGGTISFRLLVDGARRLSALVQDLATTLASPAGLQITPVPVVSGVGHPGDEARIQRLVEEAGEELRQGHPEAAQALLEQAIVLSPEAVRRAECVVSREGRRSAEVIVDSARRAVSILLREPLVTGSPSPSALLVDPTGQILRAMPFEPVPGATYLLAEFRDVPDGEWMLRVDLPDASSPGTASRGTSSPGSDL